MAELTEQQTHLKSVIEPAIFLYKISLTGLGLDPFLKALNFKLVVLFIVIGFSYNKERVSGAEIPNMVVDCVTTSSPSKSLYTRESFFQYSTGNSMGAMSTSRSLVQPSQKRGNVTARKR